MKLLEGAMMTEVGTATIAGLNHDLVSKRSTVVLVWDDEADKRLHLPVPFGCALADLPAEADKALRELAAETAVLTLRSAG
jgi:hypothetical protein